MKAFISLIGSLVFKITGTSTVQSLMRTAIFTTGHFCIDVITNYYITGAPIELVAISALLSPILNAIWYFLLDKYIFTIIFNNYRAKS